MISLRKTAPFFVTIAVLLAIAACNSESEQKPPNILFAIADDASWLHMSAYGCNWIRTPAFDKVAKKGLLFNRAYTPNAKCSPSRACILTGRNSWQLEEACNHVPDFPQKFKTYVEVLSENGYHTGYTGKGWAPGRAVDADGNPRLLTGKKYSDITRQPPTNAISAIDYAANFDAFMASRPQGEPFCFWYGGYEPHRAYEYGSGQRLSGKKPSDVDRVFDFYPDTEQIRNDFLDYGYEIEHFDNHLNKMLQILEEKGELANTIVMVTADNGMPFPRIKGQAYEYSNHLPLAMMWLGHVQDPGRKITDLVSFIDLAPTILQAAGISGEAQGMQPITGKALQSFFQSNDTLGLQGRNDFVLLGKERHDIGRPDDQGYPVRGLLQGDMLYLKNFEPNRWPSGNPETGYLNCDGSPTKTFLLNEFRAGETAERWDLAFGKRPPTELYNIKRDPDCMHNLAYNPAQAPFIRDADLLLMQTLKEQGDPRALGNGVIFDQYKYANEKQHDFYNRFMAGDLDASSAGWVEPTDFEKPADEGDRPIN